MPLIVHCPSGCIIRIPRARAGTIVRCTECKSLLQLRSLTPSEWSSSTPIELNASLANRDATGHLVLPDPVAPIHSPIATIPTPHRVAEPANEDPRAAAAGAISPPTSAGDVDRSDSPIDSFELPVPQPPRLRFGRTQRKRGRSRTKRSATAGSAGAGMEFGLQSTGEETEFEGIRLDEDVFEGRSEDEFRFLSQFFAACIGVMGLVLIVPSSLAWNGWAALPVEPLGSRWIFIMIFLGALHIVYAVFLFQVLDRSALWSVSIFLLAVGCTHGIFTAGTWLDAGVGPVSRFLQLPPTDTAAVTLWCFLHLCFSVLLSYLCGSQALRWKQSHQRNHALNAAAIEAQPSS
jgi:hypothetical protein